METDDKVEIETKIESMEEDNKKIKESNLSVKKPTKIKSKKQKYSDKIANLEQEQENSRETKPKKAKKETENSIKKQSLLELKQKRQQLLEAAREEINRKFSGSTLVKASNPLLKINRIPTGIDMLDMILYGGIPIGRCSTFWGEKDTAKTTLALKIVANAQKICTYCQKAMFNINGKYTCKLCGSDEGMSCLWIDAEHNFNQEYAQSIGVDTEALDIFVPECAEYVVDTLEVLLQGGIDLLVLDSVGAMAPKSELKKSSEESRKMAALAQLMSICISKIFNALTTERPPTVLFINQMREKAGMYQAIQYQPGGNKFAHASALTLKHANGTKADRRFNKDGSLLSSIFKIHVERSKVCPPGEVVSFRMFQESESTRLSEVRNDRMYEIVRDNLLTKSSGNIEILDYMFTGIGELKNELNRVNLDLYQKCLSIILQKKLFNDSQKKSKIKDKEIVDWDGEENS